MDIEKIFDGPTVTPQAILDSRSNRARRQQALLQTGCSCLVSFSLNIPGAVKQFTMAKNAFEEGLSALRQDLSSHITREEQTDADTGSEALLCVNLPPNQVKQYTVDLEEYHPLGRLFDIDVLDASGNALSRTGFGFPPRRCLLCGQNAKICARSQAHSLDAIRLHVAQTLERYFRDKAADVCAAYATRALLYEVSTTPKPGLVDRANSGSHRDMNFFTFLDSSAALSPWFREMFCVGWDCSGMPADQLFQRLRFTGRRAEQAMLTATNGINTHMGLIFSLGLLCGALGATQWDGASPAPLEQVRTMCREMGKCALADFTAKNTPAVHDPSFSNANRSFGARGEAAQGFPRAFDVGLPTLRRWTKEGLSLNDAAAITLLALIAHAEDTNMIRRGGLKSARWRQTQAQEIFNRLDKYSFRFHLEELDQQYIKNDLSPGGCADLLAISLMLLFLEGGEESLSHTSKCDPGII